MVGGQFSGATSIGGQARNRIARLERDGRVDQTLDLGALGGGGGNVIVGAIQPDGKILVGGTFTTMLGATRNGIARLNTDGTLDTAFDPNATGSVSAIAVQPDGKILIGGDFTMVQGVARNRIARLNPDGSLDTAFDPNANCFVDAIAVQPDGKILARRAFGQHGRTDAQIYRPPEHRRHARHRL